MFRSRLIATLLAFVFVMCACVTAFATTVDCDAVYCFTPQDFSQTEEPLRGICITALPDPATGTVMLGSRVIQPGDILTAAQVSQMTFAPLRTETDRAAEVSYLPIYENRVEKSHTTTLSILGKADNPPVAQDSTMETYKNIPNEGCLKAEDPEGKPLIYTVTRQPKRGQVEIREDGTFLYTPKKNKVGVDSFVFTAADPAGNVSREATVTIQILKPTDAKQYTDTVGTDCRFAAEWMRNTGLFVGETLGGNPCFCPEKTVSRGQFMAMLSELLDIAADETSLSALPEDTPQWLKPYLAAALRSGFTGGLPEESLDTAAPITGGEAAVMLQNALDLSVSTETLEQIRSEEPDEEPAWSAASLLAMKEAGIHLEADQVLTRADVAQIMYTVSQVAPTAPGTAVFRRA